MPRVVVFDETGGPDVLRVVDEPVVEPAAGEVRVRIEAFAVNPLDQMIRAGQSPRPVQLPHARLGVEGTGVIDAVGSEVTGVAVGDPVILGAIPDFETRGRTPSTPRCWPTGWCRGPRSWNPSVRRRCGCRTSPPTARWLKEPGCGPGTGS
ncbi:alcohol dehydrogenase catalytic domain-containing protein [Phytohabitans houttuyneae]|uniref:Alcohol dehydrogenase-like N-terminal domain-containing protein n=1 Tax=Phytohabitans houttuyneae TaxID=1076126 RepID=A0A6V8KPN8_9ACTN|nr:alcohol dehydrogenase catalytic domain-containing protein [Phytohabitans houttuyneae]GFJ83707.1 hypothetical protein Phou_078870 [Phytohabitans houttuyneae]